MTGKNPMFLARRLDEHHDGSHEIIGEYATRREALDACKAEGRGNYGIERNADGESELIADFWIESINDVFRRLNTELLEALKSGEPLTKETRNCVVCVTNWTVPLEEPERDAEWRPLVTELLEQAVRENWGAAQREYFEARKRMQIALGIGDHL